MNKNEYPDGSEDSPVPPKGILQPPPDPSTRRLQVTGQNMVLFVIIMVAVCMAILFVGLGARLFLWAFGIGD
jgi:hypothetical protein